MKKGDLLFVYGSLRKGGEADLSRNKAARFVSNDMINGKLYAVSWYPGVKTQPGHFNVGEESVFGDVFELLTDNIVGQLDSYEGHPTLFNRIETETGGGRHVWVYTFVASVSEDQRVRGGDWLGRPEIELKNEITSA